MGRGSGNPNEPQRSRWQWVLTYCVLVALLPLFETVAASQSGTQRTLRPIPEAAPAEAAIGHYYALVIGIDHYPPPLPQLNNPVSDARAVGAVLEKDYGFQVQHLLDANATRANILEALTHYRNTLQENDSLLIYYAGHGDRDSDEAGGRAAYWIPVDADSKESPNSISSSDLAVRLREMLAGHVLVIADSCYAGDLRGTRSAAEAESAGDLTLAKRMLRMTSRDLMASGNDEPVMDSGGSGHSVFARELLEGLQSLPGTMFTGEQLFMDKVQTGVVSKAQQTPIYDLFPGAGDGGGDFVFVRAGKTPGVVASNTEVAAPTRTVRAPPPVLAWVPPARGVTPELRSYDIDLLAIRDNPELIDRLLPEFTRAQVEVEQRIWRNIDLMEKAGGGSGGEAAANLNLNPKKPAFVFEWQKLMEAQPELARGPVLNVFLTPAADWSFVKREPGWSDRYNQIVEVMLFSRGAIEGRNPEFAARELAPLMRKQLQMAAAKAPTSYCFTVALPAWDYDFEAKAIRFQTQGKTGGFDLLGQAKTSVFSAPPANSRDYAMVLPASLSTSLAYGFPGNSLAPEVKLGVVLPVRTADERWRDGFPTTGESTAPGAFPDPQSLALDRELNLASIPMDAKVAERLMNGQSVTGSGPGRGSQVRLSARVYIDVDHVALEQDFYEGKSTPFTVTVARLRKVEIRGLNDELIRTLDAASFRSAWDALAAAAAERAKAETDAKAREAEQAATAQRSLDALQAAEDKRKEEVRRQSEEGTKKLEEESNARVQAIFAQLKKREGCEDRAYKIKGDPNSPDYRKAYDACMAEK